MDAGRTEDATSQKGDFHTTELAQLVFDRVEVVVEGMVERVLLLGGSSNEAHHAEGNVVPPEDAAKMLLLIKRGSENRAY